MSKKQTVIINNQKFRVGELIHIDELYVRIKEIHTDWDDGYVLTVESVYTEDGKPCETEQFMSLFKYTGIQKAAPVLRKRINNLIDEEERLQQILSQCEKES